MWNSSVVRTRVVSEGRGKESGVCRKRLDRRSPSALSPRFISAVTNAAVVSHRIPALFAALLALTAIPIAGVAAPPVEMELLTAPSIPVTAAQKWVQEFKGFENVSVRIRSGNAGEKVGIENVGTKDVPSYRVVGILDAAGRLKLPGGSFRLGDRTSLGEWIDKLRAGGESAPTERTSAFGMTAEELVALHDALSKPVDFSTRDERIGAVVNRITKPLAIEIAVDAAAERRLGGAETLADELQGLTAGTALAASLRPLGLVLVAERTTQRRSRLVMKDSRDAKEFWPIGWPPEKDPGAVAPDMFKFLTVEIADTPLSETLDAVQARVNIPFLIDQNSLARARVDLTRTKVNLPEARTYYKKILDQALGQAKLTGELRVDESGHPFLWISSGRP